MIVAFIRFIVMRKEGKHGCKRVLKQNNYETLHCTWSRNFDISCCNSSSSCIIVDFYEVLMSVELFFGGILEPNIDIYASICPWNQFNLILQTRVMQFRKNTHLFLAFEELDIETELSLSFRIFNILNLALY